MSHTKSTPYLGIFTHGWIGVLLALGRPRLPLDAHTVALRAPRIGLRHRRRVMYSACIRRVAGGTGIKTAKRSGSALFLPDTCAANLATFIERRWPKGLTSFLCYGRSVHTERKLDAAHKALLTPPARRHGHLAVRDSQAVSELLRAAGCHGGDSRLPPSNDSPKPLGGGLGGVGGRPPSQPAATRVAATTVAAAAPSRVSVHHLRLKRERGEPISMVTAYDYPTARIADAAGADALLVGDSVGMVVLGREDTTEVTMDEMIHHCRAAANGNSRALLVGDLPFGSCLTPLDAAKNGVRLLKEGRVDAVKLEGGARMIHQVHALVDAGVAVMGHIGLTPQSYAALGGYRVQGRTAAEASALLSDARQLEEAGCFAIVLEMVPAPVAALITQHLSVPTIGIGAGAATSGQIQVFHDLVGLYDQKVPRGRRRI